MVPLIGAPLNDPWISPFDGDRLIIGVSPAILAKGPTSDPASDPAPPDAASSSPATNLLNFPQREPDTLSLLSLGIQDEDSSFGDCLSLLLRSSNAVINKV